MTPTMTRPPTLLALDFDGVLCDGLIEYFQTAWQAYQQIWPPVDPLPPSGLADRFYALRPVVETGWEMPVLLRSLLLGAEDAAILDDWPTMARALVAQEQLDPAQLAAAVDGVRDAWIARDPDHWLAQHRFYPGVLKWLTAAIATCTVAIVTTKEGRFVSQLLQQQGIQLPPDRIWGKEVKQPKYETLRQLRSQVGDGPLWFVEDRLPALEAVHRQPDLQDVILFFAAWGYNTDRDRAQADALPMIQVLALEQFSQPFPHWQPLARLAPEPSPATPPADPSR